MRITCWLYAGKKNCINSNLNKRRCARRIDWISHIGKYNRWNIRWIWGGGERRRSWKKILRTRSYLQWKTYKYLLKHLRFYFAKDIPPFIFNATHLLRIDEQLIQFSKTHRRCVGANASDQTLCATVSRKLPTNKGTQLRRQTHVYGSVECKNKNRITEVTRLFKHIISVSNRI